MTSNSMTCWIAGLPLMALTIAMHAVGLVYIALFLGWLREQVVRSNLSRRSMV
jgi:hypothetical protein